MQSINSFQTLVKSAHYSSVSWPLLSPAETSPKSSAKVCLALWLFHTSHTYLQIFLLIPAICFITSLYLIVAPIIENPSLAYLYAGIVILAGLIFYFPFIFFKKVPPFMSEWRGIISQWWNYKIIRVVKYVRQAFHVKICVLFLFGCNNRWFSCFSWSSLAMIILSLRWLCSNGAVFNMDTAKNSNVAAQTCCKRGYS